MNKYYNEVRETIRAVMNSGFKLIKVDYDCGYGTEQGHDFIYCKAGNSLLKATEAILAVDESHLFIKTPSGDEVWVYFVLGNEAGLAVNDWSIPSDKDEAEALKAAISDVSDKWEATQ